jgi:hypothetical protein
MKYFEVPKSLDPTVYIANIFNTQRRHNFQQHCPISYPTAVIIFKTRGNVSYSEI